MKPKEVGTATCCVANHNNSHRLSVSSSSGSSNTRSNFLSPAVVPTTKSSKKGLESQQNNTKGTESVLVVDMENEFAFMQEATEFMNRIVHSQQPRINGDHLNANVSIQSVQGSSSNGIETYENNRDRNQADALSPMELLESLDKRNRKKNMEVCTTTPEEKLAVKQQTTPSVIKSSK
ncbi:hypothetical protein RFI_06684 [Reticulomyxa filosa]|uniref:Uncharacterized protein n=1 Tax=Reticulomyxa filosa TaxID=46433 RepID=X6NVW5_RETFI|nr:hypothetical protein RFI_06684 [Reticulomyxa filosa]|eukprot:ETO30435.1 hypothetical protein RFI_06684 [Reticulomyxa filosa]